MTGSGSVHFTNLGDEAARLLEDNEAPKQAVFELRNTLVNIRNCVRDNPALDRDELLAGLEDAVQKLVPPFP